MKTARVDLITKLAGICHDKRVRVYALGSMNKSLNQEIARKETIEYEIAKAELNEAEAKLRAAQCF